MSSKTEISNMSIANLGIGLAISNIETERSTEALACKLFYDTARDATLADFPWPFAGVDTTLSLIQQNPNIDWKYSYRYPSDCLHIRRIVNGFFNETRQTREPYRIAKDASGRIIYTNIDEARIEYTQRVIDPNFYSPEFILAFSYRLSFYIAPRITKGDPFKMKQEMWQLYMAEIGRAKANAMNEQQDPEVPESEFVRVRDGYSYERDSRFD